MSWKWFALENITLCIIAAGVFLLSDGWYKLAAIVPLLMINNFRRQS